MVKKQLEAYKAKGAGWLLSRFFDTVTIVSKSLDYFFCLKSALCTRYGAVFEGFGELIVPPARFHFLLVCPSGFRSFLVPHVNLLRAQLL